MELHLTATECHLPYGITVLPATRHKFTPARLALDLPTLEGWTRWLVTYRDGLPICRRSPIQVL